MKCNIKIHKYISEQKQGNNILKDSYLFKPITDEKTTLCVWAKFSLWSLHATSDTHTVVHSPFSTHIQINQQEIHTEASVINCNMSKLADQIKMKLHRWTWNLMRCVDVLSSLHEIINDSTIIMMWLDHFLLSLQNGIVLKNVIETGSAPSLMVFSGM